MVKLTMKVLIPDEMRRKLDTYTAITGVPTGATVRRLLAEFLDAEEAQGSLNNQPRVALVRELFAEGRTLREITEITGCSKQTVRRYLKRTASPRVA
jgi:DNA-directed RNA polymerase specialized sigma24 family protein